jgi:hypothetical protein
MHHHNKKRCDGCSSTSAQIIVGGGEARRLPSVSPRSAAARARSLGSPSRWTAQEEASHQQRSRAGTSRRSVVTGRRSGSTCATTVRHWSCPSAAAHTCWSSCATSTSSARPRCTRRRGPSLATRRRRHRARSRSGRRGEASTRSWAASAPPSRSTAARPRPTCSTHASSGSTSATCATPRPRRAASHTRRSGAGGTPSRPSCTKNTTNLSSSLCRSRRSPRRAEVACWSRWHRTS